ncbi:hypothetical protein METBIDRAFT_29514 [Metschnikowia bicuspidata var. bicuspidata NRRL YB-4993]|uniref:Uncharacterized protein n=1 Tax=Metschnikowia bicuspidata var. bicuspidata NRRL YB-4993 TaxID=869754 RepID=A0A1A0HGF0_9ASCO|nr:hypothetical protein METBIDRAFT_29514 [Metschnikowia bicuspidata var. bicuspidata NRRL YB-4993]OBA22957.1 hypothetical protein METBIDRAFT_29514 [Metschnikowia bicuspidata var. bicuspidata NRRL YB-4993]
MPLTINSISTDDIKVTAFPLVRKYRPGRTSHGLFNLTRKRIFPFLESPVLPSAGSSLLMGAHRGGQWSDGNRYSLSSQNDIASEEKVNIAVTTALKYNLEKLISKTNKKIEKFSHTHSNAFKNKESHTKVWKKCRKLIDRMINGRKELILTYSVITPGSDTTETRIWDGEWVDFTGERTTVSSHASVKFGTLSLKGFFVNFVETIRNLIEKRAYFGKIFGEDSVFRLNLLNIRIPPLLELIKRFAKWWTMDEGVKTYPTYHCDNSIKRNTRVDNLTLLLEALDRMDAEEAALAAANGTSSQTGPILESEDIPSLYLPLPDIPSALSVLDFEQPFEEHFQDSFENMGATLGYDVEDYQSLYTHATPEYICSGNVQETNECFEDDLLANFKAHDLYESSYSPISVSDIPLSASSNLEWRGRQANNPIDQLFSPMYHVETDSLNLKEENSGGFLKKLFRAMLLAERQPKSTLSWE